jgi:hypothetical protein
MLHSFVTWCHKRIQDHNERKYRCMAPDQQAIGNSVAHGSIRAMELRMAMACVVAEQEKEQERLYDPYLPKWWTLQCRQYDRINAHRDYLKQVAKAKRHLNQRRFRKLARKKMRR